ncbi:hypothetical protein D3C76_1583650 [compost metagenome]
MVTEPRLRLLGSVLQDRQQNGGVFVVGRLHPAFLGEIEPTYDANFLGQIAVNARHFSIPRRLDQRHMKLLVVH